MIFVTVGTHEQPFDRLIRQMDMLCKEKFIREDIVMQTGYSDYEPSYCEWNRLFSYQDMQEYVRDARIVITHGGPSSFIMPLQIGKIPIVVPRRKEFGEHVNDHQVEFCRVVAKRMRNVILVEDIGNLRNVLENYGAIARAMAVGIKSNNKAFIQKLEKIVENMSI